MDLTQDLKTRTRARCVAIPSRRWALPCAAAEMRLSTSWLLRAKFERASRCRDPHYRVDPLATRFGTEQRPARSAILSSCDRGWVVEDRRGVGSRSWL